MKIKEKAFVEKELHQLMEITLKLEYELEAVVQSRKN